MEWQSTLYERKEDAEELEGGEKMKREKDRKRRNWFNIWKETCLNFISEEDHSFHRNPFYKS